MKRVLSIIFHLCTWILITLLAIGALLLLGTRPFGYSPYLVLSGSMEPSFPAGALIYVKRTAPLEVKVGDPITFVLNENLVVATHRVVDIRPDRGGFITKGDANRQVDQAPVHFNNLIGIPRFQIPKIGFVIHALARPPGLYYALAVIVSGLAAMLVYDAWNPRKKDPESES